MSRKKGVSVLLLLVFLLVVINYSYLNQFDSKLESIFIQKEVSIVQRVVDGDTLALDNGEKVRLLGINTPEKGEKYYTEAKAFVESKVLNKTIELEKGKDDKDLYGRLLRYVYYNGENINLLLVREGYANTYFPEGKDRYTNEFLSAWNDCMKENKNICKSSDNICGKCIKLKELNVASQRVVLYNECSFECNLKNWEIKDEGRKKFVLSAIIKPQKEISIIVGEGENKENTLFWTKQPYVWTKTGDSLFLRDEKGNLVVYYNF
jgi:micrococcal nuclease